MEFCPNCNNYLFLNFEKENDQFQVINNCNYCGYTANKTKELKENACMYKNPNNIDTLQYYIKHKESIKYDRTIPHIDIIPCPNEECPSSSPEVRNDILYVKLDESKLKILYICNHCSSHWTN